MSQPYDVAIIGGGINGTAVACYAARCGLSVELFEKGRCGRQTTAGSSRLIHGGLRYLSHNVGTTIASCLDSGLIVRMVPHLLTRRVFVLPIFREDHWMTEAIESYLELYDRFQPLKGGKPHVRLSPSDVRALFPKINRSISGALTFDEWVVDPIHLVTEHVAGARSGGAIVREKTEVVEINHAGNLFRLVLRGPNHESGSAEARTLVNAAGPWVGRIAETLGLSIALRPTKGVHLIFEGTEAPYGILAKAGTEGYFIATPLSEHTLVGPTDDELGPLDPDHLEVGQEERQRLRGDVERVLPGFSARHRIIGETVAVRALPREPGSPKRISRDFQIIPHDSEGVPGAISVFSGKMSEYHLMAPRVVNDLGRHLRGESWTDRSCTFRLPDLQEISIPPEEQARVDWLIARFQRTERRWQRRLRAWAYLGSAIAAHWPSRITAKRRGLHIFHETYGESSIDCAQIVSNPISDAVFQEIQSVVGMETTTEPAVISECSYDLWPRRYFKRERESARMAIAPSNTEGVSKLLSLASKHRIGVIPRGAGSGVCGAVVPLGPSVTIDLRGLNEISVEDNPPRVCAGAGVLGNRLEQVLNEHYPPFTLGHFPASIAISSVGGWLGTRSSGQESTKYGSIDDLLISTEAVFPDGSVREMPFTKAQKFIGTEGTVCIFTKATFRVHPLPEARCFRAYKFAGIEEAIAALSRITNSGLKPNVVRLYDGLDALLTLCRQPSHDTSSVSLMNKLRALRHAPTLNGLVRYAEHVGFLSPLLVVMTAGERPEARMEFEETDRVVRECGGQDAGEPLAHRWFDARFSLNEKKLAQIFAVGAFVNTLDLAVRWEGMNEVYEQVRNAIEPYALAFAHISHLTPTGACLYVTYVGRGRNHGESLALYDAARDAGLGACISMGNRITHHHGIGLEKARLWHLADAQRYDEPVIARRRARMPSAPTINPTTISAPAIARNAVARP